MGSFVLQHSGTFEDGAAKVTLSVVPGSAVMVGSDSSMPERSTDPDRIFCVGNVAQTPPGWLHLDHFRVATIRPEQLRENIRKPTELICRR